MFVYNNVEFDKEYLRSQLLECFGLHDEVYFSDTSNSVVKDKLEYLVNAVNVKSVELKSKAGKKYDDSIGYLIDDVVYSSDARHLLKEVNSKAETLLKDNKQHLLILVIEKDEDDFVEGFSLYDLEDTGDVSNVYTAAKAKPDKKNWVKINFTKVDKMHFYTMRDVISGDYSDDIICNKSFDMWFDKYAAIYRASYNVDIRKELELRKDYISNTDVFIGHSPLYYLEEDVKALQEVLDPENERVCIDCSRHFILNRMSKIHYDVREFEYPKRCEECIENKHRAISNNVDEYYMVMLDDMYLVWNDANDGWFLAHKEVIKKLLDTDQNIEPHEFAFKRFDVCIDTMKYYDEERVKQGKKRLLGRGYKIVKVNLTDNDDEVAKENGETSLF